MTRFKIIFFVGLALFCSLLTYPQTNTKTTEERIEYANALLKEGTLKKDSSILAEAYYLFGKIENGLGHSEKSLEWFLKSLRIVEKRQMPFEEGRLYWQIGGLAFQNGQKEEFERLKLKAKEVFIKGNSRKGLQQFYPELVENFDNTNQKDRAVILIQKANSIRPTNPDSSLVIFDKAIEVLKGYENEFFTLSNAQAGKAEILASRGIFDQAESLLNELTSRMSSSLGGNPTFRAIVYNSWYKYYQHKNDYKNALEYLLLLIEEDKIIFEADRNGALSKLKIEYETEKNELTLKENLAEIRNQKIIITIILIGLVIAVCLIFLFYYLLNSRAKTIKTNNILIKEQNHRVKNNLQLISSLINLQKEKVTDAVSQRALEDTQFRLESMAILHRQLYDGKNAGVVNLKKFLTNVIEYALNSFGLKEQVEIIENLEEIELEPDKAIALGLIINELITNSCKYAIPFSKNPQLKFELTKDVDSLITLSYADNGPGITKKEGYRNGFGMELIKMQTTQLKGKLKIDTFDKFYLTISFIK
ncbi:sensor histidine kinase [uncultured Arcticibacterium sp.]|uniref:sensor histidine kinase n=1 Tax=uncultured Arcticibacterium sp. TaxID=2173042 RepID=UPI0030F85284